MSPRIQKRPKNRPIGFTFKALYDYLHTEYPDYGNSPFRIFEYMQTVSLLTFNSVLDVGCGSGQLLKWIKHTKPNVKCYGVDISQIALDKVNICDVALKQGLAQELPYEDNRVDLIICTHVLDRMFESDINKAIAELKRVANGYVWIQVNDCDGIEEDKYVKNSKYSEMSLLTTRRGIRWWNSAFKKHKMIVINNKEQKGKKLSFLCKA